MGVSKGNAVGYDVVGRILVGFVTAAKLEAIAVAFEGLEVPSAVVGVTVSIQTTE